MLKTSSAIVSFKIYFVLRPRCINCCVAFSFVSCFVYIDKMYLQKKMNQKPSSATPPARTALMQVLQRATSTSMERRKCLVATRRGAKRHAIRKGDMFMSIFHHKLLFLFQRTSSNAGFSVDLDYIFNCCPMGLSKEL